jgi:lipoprotein signal peptidase
MSSEPEASAVPDETLVRPSRHLTPLLLAVAAGVWVLDQVTKVLIVQVMPTHSDVRLLGGLLTITYTRNPGAAFSFGTGSTWVFTVIAVAVAVVIVRTSRHLESTPWALCLGGLLGGAVGNLTDRVFRAPHPFQGHVVDFIRPSHFAVFNVADSAITCSAIGMVLLSVLGLEYDGRRRARSRT